MDFKIFIAVSILSAFASGLDLNDCFDYELAANDVNFDPEGNFKDCGIIGRNTAVIPDNSKCFVEKIGALNKDGSVNVGKYMFGLGLYGNKEFEDNFLQQYDYCLGGNETSFNEAEQKDFAVCMFEGFAEICPQDRIFSQAD